ncbi:MAG: HD domain-containing protein [Gammaproteobacteria bacterium]|nr:HD domain-containing protein [Gammaproteobacteria bacterium]
MNHRRSDYDVTNRVQVSSPPAVLHAVRTLFGGTWPQISFAPIEAAFAHFARLFAGEVEGYHGVDTLYHDRQHSLDITLALARLLVGYERQQQDPLQQLGAPRATAGLITGLFHDVGYLRRHHEDTSNGAEFTRVHVSRGASFLEEYLPQLGLAEWVPMSTQIIHFTGYEVPFSRIAECVPDPRDITVGHLLGTADMIAQIADRCYLEKCRDRLYAEFVLGGVALPYADGYPQVKYASGLDLLRQTPEFVNEVRSKRLDGDFRGAYRYLEILYGGRNPYLEAIDRNLEYLRQILRSESWQLLRRRPPIFAAVPDVESTMRGLMLGHIKRVWSNA